jgi:outer membrane protein TolC
MRQSFDSGSVRRVAQACRNLVRLPAGLSALLALVALAAGPASSVRAQLDMPTPEPPPPAYAPDIQDPMLAPPPPAANEVASWEQALKLLRANSPDYDIGRENVVRAQAQTRAALAAILPTLNGQGSYTHQFFTASGALAPGGPVIESPPPNVWAAGGSFVWPILSPRGIYAQKTAALNADAAQLSFNDHRRQIAIDAVDAMLSTLAAGRVAEQVRIGLRTALERRALAAARLQYGQGTALDMDRADQDVAAARAQLITGDEALRQAREAFGLTLGLAKDLGVPDAFDLEAFESAVAKTCRLNRDIERRPDVAAARVRVEVADRIVGDVKLQFVPSLNAASALGYQSEVNLGPKTTWNVQGVLNVPLYDGGLRYAALRDAHAAAEQARQELSLARLNALVSAARADRLVSVYEAARDVAKTQRDLAYRVDQRTREGYARGFGTSLDLVTSAQALRQNEINLVLQDFQVGRARANAVLENAECLY